MHNNAHDEMLDLHYAASTGNVELLKALLSARTDDLNELKASLEDAFTINQQDKSGYTPLHYAVLYNQLAVVQQLLSQEAEITLRPGEAALLSNGTPEDPLYPLYNNVLGVVRKLKVDVNMQSKEGHTPLSFAAILGYNEIVQELVYFMVKETQKLFVTPEDSPDYAAREDMFVSITFEYQKQIIQGFISDHRASLVHAQPTCQQFLKDAVAYFEEQQKLLEARAQDPRYASRMNDGVKPISEIIFIKLTSSAASDQATVVKAIQNDT